MKEYNSTDTLARVTTVDWRGVIKLLRDNLSVVIAHEATDAFLQHELNSSHDIGIGKLILSIEGDEINYNFIPSKKFETELKEAFSGNDPLIKLAESMISERYLNIYKNIL